MAMRHTLQRQTWHNAMLRLSSQSRTFTTGSSQCYPRMRPAARPDPKAREAAIEGPASVSSSQEQDPPRSEASRASTQSHQQSEAEKTPRSASNSSTPQKPSPSPPPKTKQTVPITSAADIWRAQSLSLKQSPRSSPSSSSRKPQFSLKSFSNPTEITKKATAFFTSTKPSLLYSTVHLHQTPLNSCVPEVAIIGASNVGKSTIINALLNRATGSSSPGGLARTSAKAGHTKQMNAYGVGPSLAANPAEARRVKKLLRQGKEMPGHSLVLVDTPGYGYRSQEEWGKGVVGYLERRTMLRGVVVLIAGEKGGFKQPDKNVLWQLARLRKPILVVVTKADKLMMAWREDVARKNRAARRAAEADGRETDARGEDEGELHSFMSRLMEDVVSDAKRSFEQGGTAPVVHLTAAAMEKKPDWEVQPDGGNRGVAGLRAAMLEVAGVGGFGGGLKEGEKAEDVAPEKRSEHSDPEAWGGETVSFDDLEKMFSDNVKEADRSGSRKKHQRR